MKHLQRAGFAGLAVGFFLLLVVAAPAGARGGISEQFFRDCDEALQAGVTNIPRGAPGYSAHLDADNDGIACESSGEAAATTAPAATPAPVAPAPTTPPAVAPPTEVQGATELPVTGMSWVSSIAWVSTAIALFVAGAWLIRIGYEHQSWIGGRRAEVRYTVERTRRR